jgi:hypothetical protein
MSDNAQLIQAAPVNWDAELKGAQYLVRSGLVPRDIKTAESALFVILSGRDMGLSPVQSLRGIRPIQGKIELSADLQLGLFHRSGGKSQWVELSDKIATLKLLAPWSIEPHLSSFSIEDAKRAQLLSNQTWLKYPKAMLRSRAITQGLKDIGFILGAGVYAPGEIGGSVIIDEATGEVLPGETDVTPTLSAGLTSTHGVIEALPDEERERVVQMAGEFAELVARADKDAALAKWQELDNDTKIALWGILDKSTKKTIKEWQAGAKNAAPPGTSPAPTLDDALRAIKADDYELAADMSRRLAPKEAELVAAEIETSKGQ